MIYDLTDPSMAARNMAVISTEYMDQNKECTVETEMYFPSSCGTHPALLNGKISPIDISDVLASLLDAAIQIDKPEMDRCVNALCSHFGSNRIIVTGLNIGRYDKKAPVITCYGPTDYTVEECLGFMKRLHSAMGARDGNTSRMLHKLAITEGQLIVEQRKGRTTTRMASFS